MDANPRQSGSVLNDSQHPDRLDKLQSRLSAAYKGINMLVLREGAKDFFWKAEIKELDQEDIALDIHHIFPQDWCEKQGIKRDTYNSIINKTPISYKANRKIGGHAPSVYLRKLQDEKTVQLSDEDMNALVASHGIAATTLRNDDFEAHYQSRKLALFGLIGKAMGSGL